MSRISSVTLQVVTFRAYLNRALVFISKTKMGINPILATVLLEDERAYVWNGETGAILHLPFKALEPTLFFPFDLAQVVNASRDESDITLTFDYDKMTCLVEAESIKAKIKLLDPTAFVKQKFEGNRELVEVDDFYARVKRAAFSASMDASLPLLQSINFSDKSVASTDQRAVWLETSPNKLQFVVPKLLSDHIQRLALEPTKIGLTQAHLFVYYTDMTIFGSRLASDNNYPNIDRVIEEKIRPMADLAVVKYDQKALAQKLELLSSLPQNDKAIKVECEKEVLTITNITKESADTLGETTLQVSSTADFKDVVINSELFLNGVNRFTQFSIKDDQRRVLFWDDACQYCVSRRSV